MTIPLFKVAMSPKIEYDLPKIINSGYVGEGSQSKCFEELLQRHFCNRNLKVVNSGTSALHLAVRLVKDKYHLYEDDYIACPVLSCFASAVPILNNNLRIKWVDVNPLTFNINFEDLNRQCSGGAKAIMVVHWGGVPVDYNKLEEIAQNWNIPIIEDCAHVWNATYKDKLVGNFGNYSCFSFQAIKFLTTVDGGMIITPDVREDKKARLLRWFGLDREAGQNFRCEQDIKRVGYKMQPHDVMATIGLNNYDLANANVEKNRENAKFYLENLENIDGLVLPTYPKDSNPSWWLFTIKVERRDDFKRMMLDAGIEVNQVHTRMDNHSCVSQFKRELSNMDAIEREYISIPVGWWLFYEDRQYIVDTIKKGW